MQDNRRLKAADIAVIILLLLIFALPQLAGSRSPAEYAEVICDGKELMQIPMNKDDSYTPEGIKGHMTITVKNGKIAVTRSDCTGQQCVNTGYISAGSIVCAPNKAVITVHGGSTEYDVII